MRETWFYYALYTALLRITTNILFLHYKLLHRESLIFVDSPIIFQWSWLGQIRIEDNLEFGQEMVVSAEELTYECYGLKFMNFNDFVSFLALLNISEFSYTSLSNAWYHFLILNCGFNWRWWFRITSEGTEFYFIHPTCFCCLPFHHHFLHFTFTNHCTLSQTFKLSCFAYCKLTISYIVFLE